MGSRRNAPAAGRWLWVGFVAVALGAAACESTPPPTVGEVLAPARDLNGLVGQLGIEPHRCMKASATSQVCAWRLGKRHVGWEALSESTGSGKRINVVCELPEGYFGEREPGSCTAHPPHSFSTQGQTRSARSVARARDAEAMMAEAKSLVALSRLMGDVPHTCRPVDDTQQVCVWKSSNHTPGHKIAAATIQTTKRVRVRCVFPLDGGPRTEPCSIAIGS